MTTKVTFYILASAENKARDLFACRLIEKAYVAGCKIYVLTSEASAAQTFDTQLWTFRDISFVPHAIVAASTEQDIPVLIGEAEPPITHRDVLVNFAPAVPSCFSEFNRVLEIITHDDVAKAAGRKRYQFYQNHGCAVETFNIK
jgi:DNA polymerase III subunit chi